MDSSFVGKPILTISVIFLVFKRSCSTLVARSTSSMFEICLFLAEIPMNATTLPIPPEVIFFKIGFSAPAGKELIELIAFSTSLNNWSILASWYALILTDAEFSEEVELISSIAESPLMACSILIVTPSSISVGDAPG